MRISAGNLNATAAEAAGIGGDKKEMCHDIHILW
jgi:hypothetical protein